MGIEVEILSGDGPVATVTIFVIPLRSQKDCIVRPPDAVPFETVQRIASEIGRDLVQGKIGKYVWRRTDSEGDENE